mgnify:CR=1 FL=1
MDTLRIANCSLESAWNLLATSTFNASAVRVRTFSLPLPAARCLRLAQRLRAAARLLRRLKAENVEHGRHQVRRLGQRIDAGSGALGMVRVMHDQGDV